jgi:hypothetical protein
MNESKKKQRSTSQTEFNSAVKSNKSDGHCVYNSVKQQQPGNLLQTPGFEKGLNRSQLNKFQIEKPKDNFKVRIFFNYINQFNY